MSIRRLSSLALAAALACSLHVSRAHAESTADAVAEPAELEGSRLRFKQGMESYAAGDYAGAIVKWEAIFAELGRERGYRLAFNIARAYDAYGDPSRAAESYTMYIEEVARRRARGEALPALVEKQAFDAEARVTELQRSRGRLRVPRGDPPVEVRVDGGAPRLAGFVALLSPGKHVVVFGAGATAERREVVLLEGQEAVVEPPKRLPPSAPAPAPRVEQRTTRPFSPVWIYLGAGATALSILVPAVQYGRALATSSQHDASGDALERERLAADYAGQKTGAYASLAVPIVLGAATVGLGLTYAFGAKTETVRIATRGLGLSATLSY